MNMRHSWIAALAAGPVLALLLVPAGAASAGANAHGSGQVSCPVAGGTGTVFPGLSIAGSPGGLKIHFQGSFSTGNCVSAVTQPPGDQVTGGTFTGDGFFTGAMASSCANFHGADVVGQISVTINWNTTGAVIAPTTIVYKNNPGTVSGATIISLTAAPPGTATKTGSFNAPGTPRFTQLKTDLPSPGPTCPVSPSMSMPFTITGGQIKV
jgi:hypothetical protein